MAEHPFEDEAVRLFAQAPDLAGTAAFAQGVEAQLARFVQVRRWVLGAAAVCGLVIALRAIAGSGLMQGLSAWVQSFGARTADLAEHAGAMGPDPRLWIWVALGVCVAGLVTGGILQRN